jgi:hypothetical protein
VQPTAYAPKEPHEFRVRSTQGGLSTTPLASFVAGQVQHALKQGTNLVLLGDVSSSAGSYQSTPLVYDLSNLLAPRRAAQLALPVSSASTT